MMEMQIKTFQDDFHTENQEKKGLQQQLES